MKTRGLSFKTYQESQDGSSRAVTAGSPASGPPRLAPAPLREALPNPDDPSSLPAPAVFPTSALPLRLRAASLQPSLTPPFLPGNSGAGCPFSRASQSPPAASDRLLRRGRAAFSTRSIPKAGPFDSAVTVRGQALGGARRCMLGDGGTAREAGDASGSDAADAAWSRAHAPKSLPRPGGHGDRAAGAGCEPTRRDSTVVARKYPSSPRAATPHRNPLAPGPSGVHEEPEIQVLI